MEIFAWLTATLFTVAWFPQMYRTWVTKSVGDLSPYSLVIPTVAGACGLIYTFHRQEWILCTGYSVGLVCTGFLLCLYYRYNK